MSASKGKEPWTTIGTVLLTVLLMGGCATTIKHSYDARTNFAEQKSYAWAKSSSSYQPDRLLETNVQGLADPVLARKGFARVSEQSDLVITMNYEYDIYDQRNGYRLRMLNLNIYRTGNKELVWRGTAFGTIDTDAASSDLKEALEGILTNFPPK